MMADEQKACLVCGDKAHAINFNVLTCESCKAFFRRNALASKNHHCMFENRCAITVSTRKRCQKCRLQKCLEIGMKKEFILSEEERTRKYKLVQENRAKRMSLMRYADRHGFSNVLQHARYGDEESEVPADPQHPSDPEHGKSSVDDFITIPKSVLAALIFEVHRQKCGHELLSMNSIDHRRLMLDPNQKFCPLHSAFPIMQQRNAECPRSGPKTKEEEKSMIERKGLLDSNDNQLIMIDRSSELIRVLQEELSCNRSFDMNVGLSATKLIHLNGLKLAFGIMYDRPGFECRGWERRSDRAKGCSWKGGENGGQYSAPMIPVPDIIARYDDLIRRLVSFCGRISPFGYLSIIDRINLIKSAIEELMMFRGIHAYEAEMDGWKHTDPLGPVTPLVLLKHCKGNVYAIWKNMLDEFPRKYVEDENVFLSLLSMLIFNPDAKNLIDRNTVRVIRDFYVTTLLQYLVCIHGHESGTKMWRYALAHLEKVRKICSGIVLNIVLELDPNNMKPLLIEAFGF